MIADLDLGPDFFNPAIGPDQEGHAISSGEFRSHEAFWSPDSIGLHDLFVLVGDEGEWEFVFLDEFVVGFWRVGAHAKEDGAFFLYFGEFVAEGAGFFRATGSV